MTRLRARLTCWWAGCVPSLRPVLVDTGRALVQRYHCIRCGREVLP